MLANEDLKIKLLTYIMDKFVTFGKHGNLSVNVILDYKDKGGPCAIYQGRKINFHIGEADYNVIISSQ